MTEFQMGALIGVLIIASIIPISLVIEWLFTDDSVIDEFVDWLKERRES